MKKIKIMLLSLALFAVIGAALAFKVKIDQEWCIGSPYYEYTAGGIRFYCSHDALGFVTTVDCEYLTFDVITFVPPAPIATVACTTLPDFIGGCDELCPVLELIEDDGIGN